MKFLLTKNQKKQLEKNKIKKILFVKNDRIGDAICSFPLLREINKNFPSSTLDVYAGIHCDFLFKKLSFVNKVYTKHRNRHFYKTFIQLTKMRFEKYDLVILVMPFRFKSDLSIWYLNSKFVVSFGKDNADENLNLSRFDLSFYDVLAKENTNNQHQVDYLCSVLTLLGIDNYSNEMFFPYDEEKFNFAKKFISKIYRRNGLILLNIDASSKYRELSHNDIINISNALNEFTLIIACMPSKQEEVKIIIEKNNLKNCIPSYKTESIFDIAELLRVCDLLISPDTSLIHIASAINIPTIGIFNKDSINKWGPRSKINYVVSSNAYNLKGHNPIEGFRIDDIIYCVNDFFRNKDKNDN